MAVRIIGRRDFHKQNRILTSKIATACAWCHLAHRVENILFFCQIKKNCFFVGENTFTLICENKNWYFAKKKQKKMFMFTRFKWWKIKLEDVERKGWRNGVRATIKRLSCHAQKSKEKLEVVINGGSHLLLETESFWYYAWDVFYYYVTDRLFVNRDVYFISGHILTTSVYTLIYLFMINNNNKYE